jgi:hypothetical protein
MIASSQSRQVVKAATGIRDEDVSSKIFRKDAISVSEISEFLE